MIPGTNIPSKFFRGQFTYAGFDPKKSDEHFDRSPSRLSTVKVADRIVVMEKESMIEEGNHDGLLERGGHYATLYNTYFRHQSLAYIEKERELSATIKAKRTALSPSVFNIVIYRCRVLRGSNASRKPSPIRLIHRMMRMMKRLGKTHIHQAPRIRKDCACCIMLPHVEVGC